MNMQKEIAMKKLTKKLAIGVSAVLLSIAAIDASASAAYRTYYLDRHCNYYYIYNCDACSGGVRVYTGEHYFGGQLTGLPLHKSCDGRWYYQDAWGNTVYTSKHCCRRMCG